MAETAYSCADTQADIGLWFDRLEDTGARDRALAHIWANHNHRRDDATCNNCYIYWLDSERRSKDLVFPDPRQPADEDPSFEPSS